MDKTQVKGLSNEELLAEFEKETKIQGVVDGVNCSIKTAKARFKGTEERYPVLKTEILKRMAK